MSTLSRFANEVTERFEKIDDSFEKIDKRFEHIDSRFEKIDKRFDKMFVYNEQRFSAIEKTLENMATKDDIRRLESLIDGYAAN